MAGAAAEENKRASKISWAMLAATALYCVLELFYNLSLAVFVSSAQTTAENFERLETVGKLLAAGGLSLFVSGVCSKWRGILFAVCLPVFFAGITVAFDSVLNGLPDTAKKAGMHLGAYRNLVINGDIPAPGIIPGKIGTAESVALANIPLLLPEGARVSDEVLSWLTGASPGSDASAKAAIDALWKSYSSVMDTIAPHYPTYAIQSKKFLDAMPSGGSAAREKVRVWAEGRFVRKSGGIRPGLSREAFIAEVLARHPAGEKWRQAVVVPAVAKLGVAEMRAGDFPAGLDEKGFRLWLGKRLSDSVATARASADGAVEASVAKDLIASAFVPPMSMALSQASLFLNLGLLFAALVARTGSGRAPFAIKIAPLAAFSLWAFSIPSELPEPFRRNQESMARASFGGAVWAASINAETGLLRIFGPAVPALGGLGSLSLGDGEKAKPVRISKLAVPELGNLAETIPMLGGADIGEDIAEADKTLLVEESRLLEKGYYGQRSVRCNPYADKNC